MDKIQQIKDLYQKYIQRTITPSEYEVLFDLLQKEKNISILKSAMEEEWELEDFISSPVSWADIQNQTHKDYQKNTIIRKYWWIGGMAASLLIIIALWFWFSIPSTTYMVYTTGFGQVEEIELEDGSTVVLNANSELHWDTDWQDKGQRVIRIEGEAYFDVMTLMAQNSGKKLPFKVMTNDLTVNVVGTMFNVKTRGNQTDVFLDEGSVRLILHDEPEENAIQMLPGQAMRYSKTAQEFIEIEENQSSLAAWKEGTLEFNGLIVKEILKQLEEIYGVQFQSADNELLNRKITAGLPYGDWQIVQQSLSLILGVELIEKNGIVFIEK